jgi:hypothetical protein
MTLEHRQESTHHVINNFTRSRAVAIPAVLTLALGGALLSTTAAQAAPGQLVVTSATSGTVDTRTVVVEGTAVLGSTVSVFPDGDTTTAIASQAVSPEGQFSIVLPFAGASTPDLLSVDVTGTTSTSEAFDEIVDVDVTMPAYAAVTVATPTEADELDSRDVTFTGTASPGSVVTVVAPDVQEPVGQQTVPSSGTYSIDVSYDETAAEEQSVVVTSSAWDQQVERTFVLPAAGTVPPTTLPAPVITSPADGETVTGTEVTFEGTGTPGADIGLLVTPTDTVGTLADDPAARVIVDENGDWTVTLALQPAAYTAVAAQIQLDASGRPVLDGNGLPVVSDDSAPVDFVLEAAAVAPFAAPVVTSPVAGQTVVGSTLTVTGTGTPGSNVAFVIYAQGGLPQSSGPFDEAQAESTIVVDAAGAWTSTVTGVRPGAYTIAPFAFDASGATTAVAFGSPVDFTVTAAVVTAAVPTTPTGLAYTGSEGSETAAGIGAAALLAGALLLIAARRRAKLAVAETPAE